MFILLIVLQSKELPQPGTAVRVIYDSVSDTIRAVIERVLGN